MPKVRDIALSAVLACASATSEARLVDPVDPAFGYASVLTPRAFDARLATGPDGSIFVSGPAIDGLSATACVDRLVVAAFTADGHPITGFGANGVAAPAIADCPRFGDLKAVGGGRVLVAAQTASGKGIHFRLAANGQLDSAFGVAGIAEIAGWVFDQRLSLALQLDGSIVFAAPARRTNGGPVGVVVGRLFANGAVDVSFGDGGTAHIAVIGSQAVWETGPLLVAHDGAIVASAINIRPSYNYTYRTVFVRLRNDGKIDTTFGSDGIATDLFPYATYAADMEEQDERLVVSGSFFSLQRSGATLFRLDAAGHVDPTFGTKGFVWLDELTVPNPQQSSAPRIAIDAERRLWVTGIDGGFHSASRARILRRLPDGQPDAAFGHQGSAAVVLPFGSAAQSNADLQIDGAGRAYFATSAFADDGSLPTHYVVVRLLETGGHVPGMAVGIVKEYYNEKLDHYFMTADANEIALLEAGVLKGWIWTGWNFAVVLPGYLDSSLSPVCRFYGRPEAGLDSHFYSAFPAECAAVASQFSNAWLLESPNVFAVHLPDPVTGACPTASVPITRYFNQRPDANHRYTVYNAAIVMPPSWVREGLGPDAAVMCAPLF